MPLPSITLRPVALTDYPELARLEVNSFRDDPFSQVAYGPHRFDNDVLEARAKEMAATKNKPGETST